MIMCREWERMWKEADYMTLRVVWYMFSDVSEERTSSIIRVED